MIVMKFGGSSVASAERIRHVAGIIKAYRSEMPVVVLSAMGDTTDFLLEAGENALKGVVTAAKIEDLHKTTIDELGILGAEAAALLGELKTLLTGISMVRELSKKTRDYLVSFGERLSVRIMAEFLTKTGTEAQFVDAWDAGFVSDSSFMSAELLEETWQNIPKAFSRYDQNLIPVVTGFIAKDTKGVITTLGRGGSDLTATMLGSALHAQEVQTWKDVDGILSADPRIVKEPLSLPEITYEEATELAYFGAQVLHPRSMLPCIKTGTLVRVKNSYNIDSAGSLIVQTLSGVSPLVRAITSVKGVTLIDVVSTRMLGASGFLAHIFNQFLKWNISIDVIATSEVSVSLTVNTDVSELHGLLEDLRHVAEVNTQEKKAIIAIVCDVKHSSKILADAFSALDSHGINVQMLSQGASKVNISMLCQETEANDVVRILHKRFFGTD
ncbi:MAG: aspartate kinase [Treponemataceae bacterium]|nr:MAG: aspartate kinase [Treponemataceae bacterium]